MFLCYSINFLGLLLRRTGDDGCKSDVKIPSAACPPSPQIPSKFGRGGGEDIPRLRYSSSPYKA